MKKFGLVALLALIVSVSFTKAAYVDEYPSAYISAYNWAYKNGITTQKTIEKANMYGEITRIELSKMISNYAINVLKKKVDTSKKCQFTDVSKNLDKGYDSGVTKACQLGLMGQGITKFRPNDKVTRAEFATILSRLLWGDKYNGGTPYYKYHINQLNIKGIITDIKNVEYWNELRGSVMVMLKRSEEKLNINIKDNTNNNIKDNTNDNIKYNTLGNYKTPSFEELDDIMGIKCEYENGFDGGDKILVNLTKNNFILPYKDGYFGFSYGGQDGLGLYIYYRLTKNPCVTYLNSDEIGLRANGGMDINKIYSEDGTTVIKELNCNLGDKDGCYKEAKKYAYNLLIGAESNEYFSLWMESLKRMVDNNEFDSENKEGYFINWSQKHLDCITNYENKTNKIENISEYCMYELMGVCPGKDFCEKLKPQIDEQFGGDNVIYGKKSSGNHYIIGEKSYYYNKDYGIEVLLGKDFSGGVVNDGNNSILFTKYDRDNENIDLGGPIGQNLVFIINVIDKDENFNYDSYNNATFIGKNNKYQFIKKTYSENVNYDDLKIFNVN